MRDVWTNSTNCMNESVKLDGPKVSNWTVRKCQTGRSESVILDGPTVSNWSFRQNQTGRSKSVKVDGPKVINFFVRVVDFSLLQFWDRKTFLLTSKINQNLVQQRCKHTKAFMSGSDDMINKYSVVPEPISQIEFRLVPKRKMREKIKLETIEEIPLEEIESRIRDQG